MSLSCSVMSFCLAAQEKLQRSKLFQTWEWGPLPNSKVQMTPLDMPLGLTRLAELPGLLLSGTVRGTHHPPAGGVPADALLRTASPSLESSPLTRGGNSDLRIPAVKLFLPFGSADDSMVFLSPSLRAPFAETQHRKKKKTTLRRCNYTATVSMGKCSRLDSGAHIRNS